MSKTESRSKGWVSFVRDVAVMAFLIFAARSAFADWYKVPTGSMKPTILEGDHVFVNRVAYDLKLPFTRIHVMKWGDPQRGQVVVLHSPQDNKRLIKRVVAVPGDRLQIRNDVLWLNGEQVSSLPIEADQLDSASAMAPRDLQQSLFSVEQLPGQSHIIMHNMQVFRRPSYDIEVPEDFYFVMGDNRDNSADSRAFGLVHRDYFVGHAKRILTSFDQDELFAPRWDRFFEDLR